MVGYRPSQKMNRELLIFMNIINPGEGLYRVLRQLRLDFVANYARSLILFATKNAHDRKIYIRREDMKNGILQTHTFIWLITF